MRRVVRWIFTPRYTLFDLAANVAVACLLVLGHTLVALVVALIWAPVSVVGRLRAAVAAPPTQPTYHGVSSLPPDVTTNLNRRLH